MLRASRLLPTVLVTTAATGLAGSAAAAALKSHDVPKILHTRIDRVNDRGAVAVLLPSRLRTDDAKLYPGGGPFSGGYALSLSTVRGCHGANACTVAVFSAERGAKAHGEKKVKLARGRTGRYTPLHCGASCSPPTISWRERGVAYSISAKVNGGRATFVKLANSAIRSGAR